MCILKSLIVYLVFNLLFCCIALAQETTPTNTIYLLDVSGSMRREELFENIKERLKHLVEERNIGDRVVLITFGDEKDTGPVLDIPIDTNKDIEYIKNRIDNLRAESPWTWMSKAFEVTKEKAQDIKAKSPEKRLMVYILTDCINDPPPQIKKVEPPWKFVEVLLKYFEGFEVKDTYIYLLSYRALEPEEKITIDNKTPIIVKEPEIAGPIPRIKLSFSGFDFGEIDISEKEMIRSGEINIDELQDIAPGVEVQLLAPANFKVNPEVIVCNEKMQKEKIFITIPLGFESGEYAESIKLSADNVIVEPSQLHFSFVIPEVAKPEVVSPIIPRIKLSFSGFDFGKLDISEKEMIRSGEINIDELQDIAPGVEVQLLAPANFKVNPEVIVCNEKMQKEKIFITIPLGFESGEYAESIKLSADNVIVEPSQLHFSFVIPEAVKTDIVGKYWRLIFLLFILLLIYVLYDSFIRTKILWVRLVDEERQEEVELKGWKKVYMGERIADKYITFGLPKHFLQRVKWKSSVFLTEEGGEKKEVIYDEDFQCMNPDGKEVTLIFYKSEPLEKGKKEIEEETKGPSPWDRVDGKNE